MTRGSGASMGERPLNGGRLSSPASLEQTPFHGSTTTLPFVIPSAAEGSAVQRALTGNVFKADSWPREPGPLPLPPCPRLLKDGPSCARLAPCVSQTHADPPREPPAPARTAARR